MSAPGQVHLTDRAVKDLAQHEPQKIILQLELMNGVKATAPLEAWIQAIIYALDDAQTAKVFDSVEGFTAHMLRLHLPGSNGG